MTIRGDLAKSANVEERADIAIDLELSYQPEVQPKTYGTVIVERVSGPPSPHRSGFPEYRVGSLVHYTYKSKNHDQALQAVLASLKRQGENVLNWKEVR